VNRCGGKLPLLPLKLKIAVAAIAVAVAARAAVAIAVAIARAKLRDDLFVVSAGIFSLWVIGGVAS
jgi:hypothetical protein